MSNPLDEVYGEDSVNIALEEIKKLKANSNIPFDKEYTRLGISFMSIKAQQILENKKKKCSLVDLVRESFGEAAIYKYNCN